MSWIDGFVIPVPEVRRADYAAMAERMGRIFLDHGATQVIESWRADVPHGKLSVFYRAVAAEPGDMSMFNSRRMFMGGFEQILWMGKEA